MNARINVKPKPKLKPETLYFGDNGRCFCGACAGISAKYTGRDISGQRVAAVTESDADYFEQSVGEPLRCERCGRTVARRGVR